MRIEDNALAQPDAIRGQRYRVQIAKLSDAAGARLAEVMVQGGLSKLVNARNPLDLTPMANEDAYEGGRADRWKEHGPMQPFK